MQRPRFLAPGGAPGLEAKGLAQLEALQKLAAEEVGRLLELGGAGGGEPSLTQRLGGVQIDPRAAEVELHLLPAGLHPLPPGLVEQRAQAREAPAQGAAGVVGQIPEERAELLAGLRPLLDQKVAEQRTRLLRRRKLEPRAAPLDADGSEDPQGEWFRGPRPRRAPLHRRLRQQIYHARADHFPAWNWRICSGLNLTSLTAWAPARVFSGRAESADFSSSASTVR